MSDDEIAARCCKLTCAAWAALKSAKAAKAEAEVISELNEHYIDCRHQMVLIATAIYAAKDSAHHAARDAWRADCTWVWDCNAT